MDVFILATLLHTTLFYTGNIIPHTHSPNGYYYALTKDDAKAY